MTFTEKYNEYVQEWIKENPAFSGPYEDYYLEFDEWIYNYIIEFSKWLSSWREEEYIIKKLKEFKKEKGL
jgi:hypothetical protein